MNRRSSKQRDLKSFLSLVPVAGLEETAAALEAGQVQAGTFAGCLMHHLSAGSGQLRVTSRPRFEQWISRLARDSGMRPGRLLTVARRLVRAFDDAHPDDGLILDVPHAKYNSRYPKPGYRLTKQQALRAVRAELDRRVSRREPVKQREEPRMQPATAA